MNMNRWHCSSNPNHKLTRQSIVNDPNTEDCLTILSNIVYELLNHSVFINLCDPEFYVLMQPDTIFIRTKRGKLESFQISSLWWKTDCSVCFPDCNIGTWMSPYAYISVICKTLMPRIIKSRTKRYSLQPGIILVARSLHPVVIGKSSCRHQAFLGCSCTSAVLVVSIMFLTWIFCRSCTVVMHSSW